MAHAVNEQFNAFLYSQKKLHVLPPFDNPVSHRQSSMYSSIQEIGLEWHFWQHCSISLDGFVCRCGLHPAG